MCAGQVEAVVVTWFRSIGGLLASVSLLVGVVVLCNLVAWAAHGISAGFVAVMEWLER